MNALLETLSSLVYTFLTSRNLAVRVARMALLFAAIAFLVLFGIERGLPIDANWNWVRLMVGLGAVVLALSFEAQNEDWWWWSRYVVWGAYAAVAVPIILWQWVSVLLRQSLAIVGG